MANGYGSVLGARVRFSLMSQFEIYPDIEYLSQRPCTDDLDKERAFRKWEVALGYRIFGKMRWGQLGDGHISARDPILEDHFWVLAYGVPFSAATVNLLCLVGPDGQIVEGPTGGGVNLAAYNIHWPILDISPGLVSAAHTHTPYGTPWSAMVKPFEPISQESCVFVFDQVVYQGENLEVDTVDGGRCIGRAMGDKHLCILRNHGLLTAGNSPAEAVGYFVLAERVAEVHIKAPNAVPISSVSARSVADALHAGDPGWKTFQWLARDLVPDPSVVLH